MGAADFRQLLNHVEIDMLARSAAFIFWWRGVGVRHWLKKRTGDPKGDLQRESPVGQSEERLWFIVSALRFAGAADSAVAVVAADSAVAVLADRAAVDLVAAVDQGIFAVPGHFPVSAAR